MDNSELIDLGFAPFFHQQISLEERERCDVVRVTEVQRSQLTVTDGRHDRAVPVTASWQSVPSEQRPTVGDWVLLSRADGSLERVLDRKSVFRRIAAGEKSEIQLIASNIDTLFVVTSCNKDFNESRLERYLSLALEAQVTPVIVITKADLAETVDEYRDRMHRIAPAVPVELVNALDPDTLSGLLGWVTAGQTIAFVGSSGVGKSTLINSLLGRTAAQTGAIREDDSRGRHTTSYRALFRLPDGGLLIDVPGMRELKVAEVETVLDDVFADIAAAAERCRFKDCSHASEPGCAVLAAVDAGTIDRRRLQSFRRLQREDARHSASLAERRDQDRKLGKLYKSILNQARQRRNK